MRGKHSRPPALATWLLLHLCDKNQDALVGDLFERFDEGQSAGWFWRQVLIAISFGVFSELRARWLGGQSAKIFSHNLNGFECVGVFLWCAAPRRL